MLNVEYKKEFAKAIGKIRDQSVEERIKKQVEKIIDNPEIGKPMRYARKGTREVYVSPYRIAYSYLKSENKIIILDLYHKDEQ